MYQKTRLDNGLRVTSYRMPKMQSVAIGIWISAGGRYEVKENKGISHYLEHLLFKGSKKYDCRGIKESIEGIGGSLNGFTSEELTCYLAKLPAKHLGLALDVLSDMVINPLLAQEEIDKERTVILEEIKMYRDQPQSYVHELLDELLWPGQPLGMSVIGTEESVNSIDRQKLQDYKKAHYTPRNIVIAAAGLLEHKAFVNKVGKIFSCLNGNSRNVFKDAVQGQQVPKLKVWEKDTEQTHMALGFHSLKRDHPLKYALALLHIILGANMSSRLFEELREKRGLAYEIGTQVKRYKDTGAFVVHAGIDNRKVSDALVLILQELAKLKDKLVTLDECRRAKEFYLGQLMLSLEETMDQMFWAGESTIALNKTYTFEEIFKQIKRVTREDIRKAAGDIFREKNLNLALIGPLKDRQEEIQSRLHIN